MYIYIISNNIFFCSPCLHKLPSALSAYDNVNEACSFMEKSIKSVETTLSNRIGDQVKELSSKITNQVKELSSEISEKLSGEAAILRVKLCLY